MHGSLLLYTLLALWMLPALALVVVYCFDAARDGARRLIARWHCYWARRGLRRRADAQAVATPRQPLVTTRSSAAMPALAAAGAPDAAASFVVRSPSMRVPLVVKDERGDLHMQQWTLELN